MTSKQSVLDPPARDTFEHPGPLPGEAPARLTVLAPDVTGAAGRDPAAPPLAGRPRPQPGLRQSFSALRHRNFRLFWTGQLISLIGTWMQMIARAWLVYKLAAGTGQEGFWLGMVGLASAAPVLVISLYAGVITDRVSKWRIIVATQTSAMILAFVLGGLTHLGIVQIWQVLLLSVLTGVVNAFDGPARQAFVVEMAGKEDLLNAVALNSTIFNAARVLGPAVAGVALGLMGPALCFDLNGVSYLAVITGLLMMRLPPFVPRAQSAGAWVKLKEGLAYVRQDRIILPVMLLVGINSLFGMTYSTLAPIFADSVLRVGESGYGLLMAAAGVGALLGAVNLAVQSGRASIHRGRLILAGSILFGVFLCGFALSRVFALSLVLLAAVGWSMISQNATSNTVVQTTSPDHLRGRVMSVYSLLMMGVAPLGAPLAGWMADVWGAPVALFFNGAVCVTTGIWIWRWRPQVSRVQ